MRLLPKIGKSFFLLLPMAPHCTMDSIGEATFIAKLHICSFWLKKYYVNNNSSGPTGFNHEKFKAPFLKTQCFREIQNGAIYGSGTDLFRRSKDFFLKKT